MPRTVDALHHGRVPLGDPAENEKGGAGSVTAEEVEKTAHAIGYTALQSLPSSPGDVRLKGGDLKVLLDVYREVMDGLQTMSLVRVEYIPAPRRGFTPITARRSKCASRAASGGSRSRSATLLPTTFHNDLRARVHWTMRERQMRLLHTKLARLTLGGATQPHGRTTR